MLAGIGFDVDDLDDMLRSLGDGWDREELDEDLEGLDDIGGIADQMQQKWRVEQGDLWQVGEHYVICGDSRESGAWQALFTAAGIAQCNGIITSPPYAEQRKSEYGGVSEQDYVDWWGALQANSWEYLQANGSFFLNIKPHSRDGERVLYVFDLVLAMRREWDWLFVDEFCWERIGAPGSWPNRFRNAFEPVYHFAKQQDIKFRPRNAARQESGAKMMGDNRSTGNYYNTRKKFLEWDVTLPTNRLALGENSGGNAAGFGHAAAFPPAMPEFFIRAFSDPGDVWVDPFAGSGTVAVAAHKAERIGLLIELVPEYVAVTLERLQKVTKQEPRKVE